LPCPLSALEAVPMDTPASAATSRMVTRLICAPRVIRVRAGAVDASRDSL
jgi:hypothetical protein